MTTESVVSKCAFGDAEERQRHASSTWQKCMHSSDIYRSTDAGRGPPSTAKLIERLGAQCIPYLW
eukprot:1162694-Pleurochrysis_carterae.AAC.8